MHIEHMQDHEIAEYLRNARNCALILWSIEDLQAVRPELTTAEAKEVIAQINKGRDCEIGISWETLRIHADWYLNEKYGTLQT